MSCRRIFAVLMAGLLVAGSAFARGKKIDRSELPAAVETALQLESQGGAVKHCEKAQQRSAVDFRRRRSYPSNSKVC